MDESRNYFLEEIKQNELMSKKYKKFCTTLNYIENLVVLASRIIGSVSSSAFPSLIAITIRITSSTRGLKTFPITAGIKIYKPIIKKKKKKHDKIVPLAKSKLNSIEVIISKALIGSVISHDELILIRNVLKEHEKAKEEIKTFKDLIKFIEYSI